MNRYIFLADFLRFSLCGVGFPQPEVTDLKVYALIALTWAIGIEEASEEV